MTMIDPSNTPSARPVEGPVLTRRSSDQDPSLSDLLLAVLRHPWLVLGFPVILSIMVMLYFSYFGSYIAESSFTPEESGLSLSSVAGLAAQFGVNVPGGVGGQTESIDFYTDLIQSPALLVALARDQYRFVKKPGSVDSTSGDLFDLYGINGETEDQRVSKMVKKLQNRISVTSNRLASVIVIRVKAPWPSLAQQINRRLLDLVNDFNLGQRQSQAMAERQFVEGRRAQAQAELMAVEDSLQRFLEANRTYQTSPRLAFEAARLQRRIDIRQQVYSTLSQGYEQSRIQEVRNTPVVTIIQKPELYTRSSRIPSTMGLVTFVLVAIAGMAFAIFLEYLSQESRERPERFRELRAALARIAPARRQSTGSQKRNAAD